MSRLAAAEPAVTSAWQPPAEEQSWASRLMGGPSRPQNISETERWISTGAGAALVAAGLLRGRLSGLLAAGIGAGLIYRGMSGHCYTYEMLGINTNDRNPATAVPAQEGRKVEKTIAINRSPSELFAFWRQLENLPRVMSNLVSVEQLDSQRSRWVAQGPLGRTVEWEAEIYNERPDEMIAWRSLPGGDVETAGSVHFKPLAHGRGTAVTVSMKYNPPAGKTGDRLATLLGSGLEQQLNEDLRNFKRMMEAGTIPTTAGQPTGSTSILS